MTLLQNGRRYFDWNASSLLCDRSRKSLISNLDLVISPAATPGMMASASGVPTLIYHKPGFWNFGRIGKFVQNPFFKLTRNYHSDDISADKNLVSDVSDFLIKNKNNFQGILS